MKNASLLIAVLLLIACQSNHSEAILGSWQVDSVATFYNGFTYGSEARHWNEHYQYDSTQVSVQRTDGEQKLFYHIEQDTLYYLDHLRSPVSQFTIVRLSDRQLILLKNQSPLWEGPKQVRYEIRYFSRSDSALVTSLVSP